MAVTGAGLEGIIAAESSICYIDGQAGVLSYQGFNIHTLAQNATFEEVIYLLWNGRLPKQAELDELKAALVKYRPIPAQVIEFLRERSRRSADARSPHGSLDAQHLRPRSGGHVHRSERAKSTEADGPDRHHRHHV